MPSQTTAVEALGFDDDIVGYRRSPSDVVRLILFGLATIALLAHTVSKGKVETVGLQLADPDEDDDWQHRIKAVLAKVRKLLRLDRAA